MTHSEEFDAPASEVWELLTDWAAIVDWMPEGNIQSLEMEGQGIGAIRHLRTPQGVHIAERLDAADRQRGTLDLSILEPLPWGMLSYSARGTASPVSGGGCSLTWRGTFELPAAGPEAEDLARLLKMLYTTMFTGIRQALGDGA